VTYFSYSLAAKNMTLEASLLLASTIFILGIIPGPGVLLVVSRALSGGLFASLWTIFGLLTADLIFLFIVVYGLQAIATVVAPALLFIQIIGAVYLIWLGISVWKSPSITASTDKKLPLKAQSFYALWLTGLIITLSNPKAILFYVSFLPSIIEITTLTSIDITIMGLIICITIGGIMFFYALTAINAKNKFAPSTNKKITQRIAGSMIIATGIFILSRAYL
jgi:threonine/homoserine/homoserine lactone efflux protein